MWTKSLAALAVFSMVVLGLAGDVRAEGVVQSASKDAAKGMIKGVKQELAAPEVPNTAKQMTKEMVRGVADEAPLVTSQIANQANVNRKAIGKVARQVSSDAVAGAFGATVSEVNEALGEQGDGKLAVTMAATAEKVTAASIRGLVSEIRVDPKTMESLSAAAVRGAASEMHFNIPVWSFLLAFILGGVATLLCGVGLMLLYLLFQRRRAPVPEGQVVTPVVHQPVRARPVPSMS